MPGRAAGRACAVFLVLPFLALGRPLDLPQTTKTASRTERLRQTERRLAQQLEYLPDEYLPVFTETDLSPSRFKVTNMQLVTLDEEGKDVTDDELSSGGINPALMDLALEENVQQQEDRHATLGKRDSDIASLAFTNIESQEDKEQQSRHAAYRMRDSDDLVLTDFIPEHDKRKQGWQATYGKRDSDDLVPALTEFRHEQDKRQQGWHAMYGKRDTSPEFNDDITNFRKRQQGWHAMYGKRDTNPNFQEGATTNLDKRQQGWYATYGKRDISISNEDAIRNIGKRQQGWYSMYGKRNVQDDVTPANPHWFTAIENDGDYLSKSELERDDELSPDIPLRKNKRQQVWHTAYGKRFDEGIFDRLFDLDNLNEQERQLQQSWLKTPARNTHKETPLTRRGCNSGT